MEGPGRVRGVDPPTERTSVRVILLDAADRVLLLGARDPGDGRTVWFMPGGGVEPGETFTETADRELREELGVSGLALTGPVWTRHHDHTWDGRAIRQTEWFLLARTSRILPTDRIRPPGPEGDNFVGARWLSVEDIRTSTDLIAPRRPAELLPPLPRGRRPNHPGRDGRVASLSSKRASETPE
jgi:8-oxo-dGTP pyrophosphatase MutT (NUDIX family)